MASREFAEIELIAGIAERHDVAVGIIDVKSYYVETPERLADRVRLCLSYAPADRLSLRPRLRAVADGPLGGPRRSCANMVEGVRQRPGRARAVTALIEPRRPATTPCSPTSPPVRPPATTTLHLWWLGQAGFLVQWRRPPPAARPVPVRLADGQVRGDRQAARADDRAGRRPGAPRHHRRGHVEPQPHRPPRPRDAVAAADRQPGPRAWSIPEANRAFVADRLDTDPAWPIGLADGAAVDVGPFRLTGLAVAHEQLDTDEAGPPPPPRLPRRGRPVDAVPLRATPSPTTAWQTSCRRLAGGRTIDVAPAARSTGACRSAACRATSGATRRRASPTTSAPGVVMPMHYEMFAFNTETPELFVATADGARPAAPRAARPASA